MRRYHQHPDWPAVRRLYVSDDNNERRKLKRDGWKIVSSEDIGKLMRSLAPMTDRQIRIMGTGTWFFLPRDHDYAEQGWSNVLSGPRWLYEGQTYEGLRRGERML